MSQSAANKQFKEQFGRLVSTWPIEESRSSVLSKEFYAIFEEVGESRFTDAVSKILAESQYAFFPTIAEFRGYLPPAGKRPTCGKCQNGWIMVPDYQARRLYKNETAMCAVRCECRRGPKFQAYEKRVVAWRAPE